MTLKLGDLAPDFTADTTQGTLRFHDWLDQSWAILFSHPADFTPVCTTELGSVAALLPEFSARGIKVAALSCNDVKMHQEWLGDIESTSYAHGSKVLYPIIADPTRQIATSFGMLDPDELDAEGAPMACRGVFIFSPDKRLKLSILYPATTGRNFQEILRVIDSLQLTSSHSVATPADWQPGQQCMVQPTLPDAKAHQDLGGFSVVPVPSGKQYLRLTADPSGRAGS
ncbi:hypothetical protein WJX74_000340 [Apatococcus lobatus]|uniref:Peroxiredoxin n=1 Tax=Apatococcus lobatus TaxID=904363 RepID=A0AAW1R181_9CHLO